MRLEDIKKVRKQLGMTQGDLAKMSGVSQSMVAKIESGLLDPSYTKAVKIIDVLNSVKKKEELKAKDIMQIKIISVVPEDRLAKAIEKMKKHEISQLPVLADGKSVGRISESIVLDAVLSGGADKVSEVMDDSAPIVSKHTTMTVVAELLKFYQLVLVSDRGKLVGLITRSDVLRKV